MIVAFASVKGAPGVTTTASLVGAMWPTDRAVVLAECDPWGGDLAARFALSSTCGWTSFGAADRRSEATVPLGPHLQQLLPGGLDVLVGDRNRVETAALPIAALVASASSSPDGPLDILVDLGRLPLGPPGTDGWSEHAGALVIVVRGDAATALQVKAVAPGILSRWGIRALLAVIDTGPHRPEEIESFTGIPVIGTLAFDPIAAATAAGQPGGRRRLSRSLLLSSAGRLAGSLTVLDPSLPGSEAEPHRGQHATAGPSRKLLNRGFSRGKDAVAPAEPDGALR